MSRIDIETKRKLREMGVATLLDAFDAQDDTLTLGLAFEEKIKLAVDDGHSVFTQTKVEGLIHVHHLKSLAEIGHSYQVDPIKDLMPVCPNCHAVIHSGPDLRTPDEVKAMISDVWTH